MTTKTDNNSNSEKKNDINFFYSLHNISCLVLFIVLLHTRTRQTQVVVVGEGSDSQRFIRRFDSAAPKLIVSLININGVYTYYKWCIVEYSIECVSMEVNIKRPDCDSRKRSHTIDDTGWIIWDTWVIVSWWCSCHVRAMYNNKSTHTHSAPHSTQRRNRKKNRI